MSAGNRKHPYKINEQEDFQAPNNRALVYTLSFIAAGMVLLALILTGGGR